VGPDFWPRLYRRLCTNLRKFPAEVANGMTLSEAIELCEGWNEYPPAEERDGFTSTARKPSQFQQASFDDARSLAAQFSHG
jgi:hypothetical protein